jgi:hypothetical protein
MSELKAGLWLAYSNNNMESGSFPFSCGEARRFAEQWYWIYTLRETGLIYLGFGPFKVGYNSEKVRDLFQNKWIHQPQGLGSWDVLSDPNNGKPYYPNRFYWHFGSTGGSSLW